MCARLTFLIILAAALPAGAQSVSFAPHSFRGWGTAPEMGKVAVAYKGLGLQVVYPYKIEQDDMGNNTQTAIGISYKREIIERILRVGAVVFNRPFPTDSGIPFNFILDAGYSFRHLRLSYVHMSNAELGRWNPGMDTIQISILL